MRRLCHDSVVAAAPKAAAPKAAAPKAAPTDDVDGFFTMDGDTVTVQFVPSLAKGRKCSVVRGSGRRQEVVIAAEPPYTGRLYIRGWIA